MKRRTVSTSAKPVAGLLAAALGSLTCFAAPEIKPGERERAAQFSEKLQPVFEKHCTECHNEKKQKGGLRLDSLSRMMHGGDSGAVVRPGKPAESELIQRLTSTDEEKRMPPKGPAPGKEQIEQITQWIAAGAVAPDSPLLAETAAGGAKADPVFLGTTGANSQERLIHRRAARLALVKKPDAPPPPHGTVFNAIDHFITARWREMNLITPATEPALCDDSTFLRRVYLDVIGAVPTLTEARRFLDDNRPDKRARLVDELLARSADYAAHWTVFWLDALASNVSPTFGGVISRGDHLPWIYSSFAANKPYDVFVAELLDPTMPGFKKPGHVDILGVRYKVSFLRDADHQEVLQTAADVGQVFLGTGMKCAGCHSHFDNDEWPQKRFLAFAGLFNDKDLEQIRCEKKTGIIVPAASPFDQPGIPAAAPAGATERLHLAALLLTDPANPRFSKTIVNRLWKRFFSLGLFEPADDFRLDTPASHPALLDWLAYDFMARGCDIKHTTRLILTSRTYQLRSDPALGDTIDIQSPKKSVRYFRSPALRRLTAEQLRDSIAVVTQQKLEDARRVYRAFEGVPDPLNTALGRPDIRSEVSTARSGEVAILPALELLNGAKYNALINPDTLLASLGPNPSPNTIIETIYLATFQRPPTAEETTLGTTFLHDSLTNHKLPLREAVADTLWALFTSPAFQYLN